MFLEKIWMHLFFKLLAKSRADYFLALFKRPVLEKENTKSKPALLCLDINPVSRPARNGGVGLIRTWKFLKVEY